MNTECSNCGSNDLYVSKGVHARGGYGPDLLPGLGTFWSGARMNIVVCQACGLIQCFADEKARVSLPTSKRWKKV